jgi:hypothetical protein
MHPAMLELARLVGRAWAREWLKTTEVKNVTSSNLFVGRDENDTHVDQQGLSPTSDFGTHDAFPK